jgi:hypothetical protein
MALIQEFYHPNVILMPGETPKFQLGDNQLPFFPSSNSIREMMVCVLRDPGDSVRLLDYSV